jgi:hypothetical protein
MIRVITAADDVFKHAVMLTVNASARAGYTTEVYDLGGLGFGKPYPRPEQYKNHRRSHLFGPCKLIDQNVRGVAPWKPALIRDVLLTCKPEDYVVWLDADAWIIRPLNAIQTDDYDIGVTVRNANETDHGHGLINAGVLFLRPTQAALNFIDRWIQEIPLSTVQSDQFTLNDLLERENVFRSRDAVSVGYNTRFKFFRAEQFNFYYAPKPLLPTTAIVHFKRDTRKKHADFEQWIATTAPAYLTAGLSVDRVA